MRALLIKLAIIILLIGVFVRTFFDFGDKFPFFLCTLAIIFFIIYYFDRKTIFAITAIAILAFSTGVFRMDLERDREELHMEEFLGNEIQLEGTVVTKPEKKEKYKRFVIETNDPKQKILIYDSLLSEISYGDRVLVSGSLQKPENYYSKSENSFDWTGYLAKDNIFYEMFYPEIGILGTQNNNLTVKIKKSLFFLKDVFIDSFSRVIPEPESSLLAGELVGEKSSLGRELENDFRRTGIIHIVVLSGYNVTIVADSIIKSISFLPKVLSLYLGIAGIVAFAIMTGAGATVVRASIMAILVILARRYGRQYNISTALLLAGLIMVLHSPNILIYDASFQLSFLASVGLIYVSPKIEKYFSFITKKWNLRGIVGATIGTQLLVMPLLVYMTGEISLVALPVNILILPIVPLTMFLGFLTGAIGLLSYSFSLVPGWLATLVLMYQLKVVEIFAALPFTAISF